MKTWLTGIVMFAALTAAAQADIVAGTVVDGSSRPVANVNVSVTFASGTRPLRTKTGADGHFTVETSETPANLTLQGSRFDTYTMGLGALAPAALADLHIELMYRLVIIARDPSRGSVCNAFQPYQTWDVYVLVRGGCGMPKF